MAAPTIGRVATDLYDALVADQPGDDQRGYALMLLCGALGHAFDQLTSLVDDTDTDPGWSALLDPARCPGWALPWLAQLAGVTLTPGLSEAAQRAQITSPPAFQRGTPPALVAAAQATLTGTKQVSLLERNASPWQITVVTRTSETPNPAATEAAVRAQKPAGLLLTYVTSTAETWDEATSAWDAPAVTWDNATSGI